MWAQEFSPRHRSLLRAVAQGRGQLTCGRNPCLSVDGRWCDQTAAAELVRRGLIRLVGDGTTSGLDVLVPAALTVAGVAALAA